MADRSPNRGRTAHRAGQPTGDRTDDRADDRADQGRASPAEIDALGEVIAAAIALAARARSEAAAALLERALTTLRDGAGGGPEADGRAGATFKGS